MIQREPTCWVDGHVTQWRSQEYRKGVSKFVRARFINIHDLSAKLLFYMEHILKNVA